jgi:FkbM family methyltransferase
MVYNHLLKKLEVKNIETLIEVGGRYGTESVDLANDYPNSTIHCFECNPRTVKKCRETCLTKSNIVFNPVGVSKDGKTLPFYSYVEDNDGCSSFYMRYDGMKTMVYAGDIQTITLKDYMTNKNINKVDCLCLDTQGTELDIIKGCEEMIKNVRYIILEQPNEIPNPHYMPLSTDGNGYSHSKYLDAPTAKEIKDYLEEYNFKEVFRQKENEIEFNIVYKNFNMLLT